MVNIMPRRLDTYKLQVQLTQAQREALESHCKKRGIDRAQLVRQALAGMIPDFDPTFVIEDWPEGRRNYPRQAVTRLQKWAKGRGVITYQGVTEGQGGYFLNGEWLGSTESEALNSLKKLQR